MEKCYWCEEPFTFGDNVVNFITKDTEGNTFLSYAHQKCQTFVYTCREKGDIIKTPADFKEMKEKYANET